MSTLTQFVGGAATTAIVNFHSSGGTKSTTALDATAANGCKEILSGALTANTLATVLSVSGAGAVPQLSLYTKDATARTARLKVTVDGVVAFDATSSSLAGSGEGIFAAGWILSNTQYFPGEPILFSSSLLVEVASSLTETNKLAVGYSLYKR